MRSRVLVVDPHADIVDLLRRALELSNYQVESALSAASAIAQMECHEFAVALVNLTLPDGDGLRLLRLLKSRDPSVEVILMTGSNPSHATVVEATEQGAFHFLFKPFDLDEVLTVVANAVSSRCDTRGGPEAFQGRMIRIELFDEIWKIALHHPIAGSPLATALLAKIKVTPSDTQLAEARRELLCSVREAQMLLRIFMEAARVHAHHRNGHRLRLAGEGCRHVIDALRKSVRL